MLLKLSEPKLSYSEQLYRDAQLLPGLRCYYEVDLLRGRGRRIAKGLAISDPKSTRDDWIVYGLFERFKVPHYWLINITDTRFNSYSTSADNEQLDKFEHRIVEFPAYWERLALAEDVLPFIRRPRELHFTTAIDHTGWERTNGKWLTLPKYRHKKLYEELPLGKLYRAVDIGAIVPVYRTDDALLCLGVRYR